MKLLAHHFRDLLTIYANPFASLQAKDIDRYRSLQGLDHLTLPARFIHVRVDLNQIIYKLFRDACHSHPVGWQPRPQGTAARQSMNF